MNWGKVKSIIGAILAIAIIGFMLKEYVVTMWASPQNIEMYVTGNTNEGRYLGVILIPGNKIVFLYTEQSTQSNEVTVTQARGSYGTHYFGRFWNIDNSNGLLSFGYRVYPAGFKPVVMELDDHKKINKGSAKYFYKSEGSTINNLILFGNDAIKFDGMVLTKTEIDNQTMQLLRGINAL